VAGDSAAAGAGRAGAAGGAGRGGRGAGGAGGNAGGARRERVVLWKAPFGASDTTTLYQADGPISSLSFTDRRQADLRWHDGQQQRRDLSRRPRDAD